MTNDKNICPECDGVGYEENVDGLAPLVCPMYYGTGEPKAERHVVTIRRNGKIVEQYETF